MAIAASFSTAGCDFPMTDGEQIRDFPAEDVAISLRIGVERSDIDPAQPLVVNIAARVCGLLTC